MLILLSQSLLVGFIVWVIGTILFNLSVNKNNKDKKEPQPYGINMAFFMTGVILHILLEFGGVNRWICSKRTTTGYRMLSKLA